MVKKSRRFKRTSIFPRGKVERRRIELFGGFSVALVSALVVSIFLTSSVDQYLIKSNQYASVLSGVLVDLANGDRTQNNIHTLTVNPTLVAAAQAKANDMAAKSYFAHVSPEGHDSWYWFKEAGYAFSYAGENLAVDFSDSGDVERAWMNSPSHRENLLDSHFTEIGIATAEGTFQGHATTFVAQMFGTPSESNAPLLSETLPENPKEPALASTISNNVLGEASAPAPTSPKKPVVKKEESRSVEILGSSAVALAETPLALKKENSRYAPFWAHLITAPRSFLQYAYWALVLFILLAFLATTGFELRVHHMRKAGAAGMLLSFMLVLFVVADTYIFSAPVLTPQAPMATATR